VHHQWADTRARRARRPPLITPRAAVLPAGAVVRTRASARALAGERWCRGPTCTAWRAAARPGRGNSRRPPAAGRPRRQNSRVELLHRVRVAPQDLLRSDRAPELAPPPDDERVMPPHVEDRDHGAVTQRVAPADLGDAIQASPARPEAQDPSCGWATAHLELRLTAHLAIGALGRARVARDPRDEERSHAPLQPAFASVVAQGPAEHSRLDLSLELGDPLALSRRLAVHGILEALQELLQMRDPGLERAHVLPPRSARRGL